MNLIIFTDLDGTLLNQSDYRYDAALPILAQLKQAQIPIIPVTSKTRQEVAVLRQEIALEDPFIVENGSGVFIPLHKLEVASTDSRQHNGYYRECLGCTYPQARMGLQAVSRALNTPLRGFGDLDEGEIEALTGLAPEEVKRAKAREFSEPFLTPSHIPRQDLEKAVEQEGFRVVVGDRFCHLIGQNGGKGQAVQWLVAQYKKKQPSSTWVTIGLGNSPNDLDMLQVVDYPIIIPGTQGAHRELKSMGWRVAPAPGSQGWAAIVSELYGDFASH